MLPWSRQQIELRQAIVLLNSASGEEEISSSSKKDGNGEDSDVELACAQFLQFLKKKKQNTDGRSASGSEF
jgi:hypothetical protein